MKMKEQARVLNFDSKTVSELGQINNFDAAMRFLNTYGTDFLTCEYYRHRIFYKACHVIPPIVAGERRANRKSAASGLQAPSFDELKLIALRTLGGETSELFPSRYPERGECKYTIDQREYELCFYSGYVEQPIIEPIDDVHSW